jgi:hypothetical protein
MGHLASPWAYGPRDPKASPLHLLHTAPAGHGVPRQEQHKSSGEQRPRTVSGTPGRGGSRGRCVGGARARLRHLPLIIYVIRHGSQKTLIPRVPLWLPRG